MNCKELTLVVICLVHASSCSVIKTNYGMVKGKVTKYAISFLGIPYAKPPISNLRWKSPQKMTSWKGVYDATYLRDQCLQLPCGEYLGAPCDNTMSENCLHLNIFMPLRTKPGSKKPVMLFFHGGFFEAGSSAEPRYNSEMFARKGNVIIITFNYRLGVLGSLYTSPDGIKGNFGIEDQRLAMKWVHENIRYFGGDPKRITIFGQSAGATYVAIHLVNRKADRYFRNAILMSAPFGISTKSKEQALTMGESFSNILNCDASNSDCLRSKTEDEVINAQTSTPITSLTLSQGIIPWAPFMDGKEVSMDIQRALRNGLIGTKNIIIGTTANENSRLLLNTFPAPIDSNIYQAVLFALLPDQAASIFQRYPPNDPSDARPELTQVSDDIFFTCSSRRVAIDLSKSRHAKVWFYVFDNGLEFLEGTDILPQCQSDACHANGLVYLFQTPTTLGFQLSSDENHLIRDLTFTLTNFAKTGNPNIPYSLGKNPWPRYRLSRHRNALLYRHYTTPKSLIRSDFRGTECDLFDQDGFYA